MFKSAIRTASLAAVAMTILASPLVCVACEDVKKGDSQHKCLYTAPTYGMYKISATATARSEGANPTQDLRITIDETECASESATWGNGPNPINAKCVVTLSGSATYTIEALQDTSHAKSTGVSVRVTPKPKTTTQDKVLIVH